MLEAAVANGLEQLCLEEEVAEAGAASMANNALIGNVTLSTHLCMLTYVPFTVCFSTVPAVSSSPSSTYASSSFSCNVNR